MAVPTPAESGASLARPSGDGEIFASAVVRPLVIAGAVLAALGVALGLVSGAAPELFYLEAVKNVFWIDNDLNVWAWYSALLLALLALAFAVSAVVRRRAGQRWGAEAVFSVVAAYLSADESAALHERLGSLGERLGAGWTYAWVAVGLPIAIVVGAVLLWCARRLDRTTRRRLVVAGLVYLAGALGVETIGGALHASAGVEWTSAAYVLTAGLEESLEAAGALVALWAAIAGLRVEAGPDGLRVAVRASQLRASAA